MLMDINTYVELIEEYLENPELIENIDDLTSEILDLDEIEDIVDIINIFIDNGEYNVLNVLLKKLKHNTKYENVKKYENEIKKSLEDFVNKNKNFSIKIKNEIGKNIEHILYDFFQIRTNRIKR